MFTKNFFPNLAVVLGLLVVLTITILFWPTKPSMESMENEWTCSMHPQVRMKQPGRCPICGMNLIPIYPKIGPKKTTMLMGIETEPVRYRPLFKEIHATGKIDYNEGCVAYIASRVMGRVDRIFANFTGIQIRKGDHLAEIYSPDLFVTQDVFLQAIKSIEKEMDESSFAKATLESTRQKLLLLGILPEQLSQIEKSQKITTNLTFFAPIGGTIIEKNIRSGQYVKEGDMLYKIADLDTVWLYLDIYESDLGWVRPGQSVDVNLEAYPSEVFQGKVSFIDSFLEDKTRTVRVRVDLKNLDRKMKPAMYASARIRVNLLKDGTPEPTGLEGKFICPMHPEIVELESGPCNLCEMPLEKVPLFSRSLIKKQTNGEETTKAITMIPREKKPGALSIRSSAVLDLGRRKITYRKSPEGFQLVELRLGPLAEGHDDQGNPAHYFPVLEGLEEKDQVVVRGGFLLDSQQQIQGMPSLLQGQANPMKTIIPGEHKH